MRKACFTRIVASLSALALTGTPAWANPALMASRHPAAQERMVENTTPPAARPSALISPTKHPFKYLSTSIAESPLGSIGKHKSSNNYVAGPAVRNDSISLSTPTGAPTPQLFISLAQMAEGKGDVAQARANYQQALNLWPGQVDVLRAAARMEDRLNQLPVAESLYRRAIAANPQHAGALNDLGLCLARQGKLEESVQEIEKAIQIQPTKALYRNNAATVLVEMHQDTRALAHLAAVHDAANANYNFGELLVQRGRAADATPYFDAAVAQNPQMQSAHVALAKLRGETVPETATYTPPVSPQQQSPAAQQGAPPQQSGPQMSYPTTAQAPGYNLQGSQTRYLPPVATRPAPLHR